MSCWMRLALSLLAASAVEAIPLPGQVRYYPQREEGSSNRVEIERLSGTLDPSGNPILIQERSNPELEEGVARIEIVPHTTKQERSAPEPEEGWARVEIEGLSAPLGDIDSPVSLQERSDKGSDHDEIESSPGPLEFLKEHRPEASAAEVKPIPSQAKSRPEYEEGSARVEVEYLSGPLENFKNDHPEASAAEARPVPNQADSYAEHEESFDHVEIEPLSGPPGFFTHEVSEEPAVEDSEFCGEEEYYSTPEEYSDNVDYVEVDPLSGPLDTIETPNQEESHAPEKRSDLVEVESFSGPLDAVPSPEECLPAPEKRSDYLEIEYLHGPKDDINPFLEKLRPEKRSKRGKVEGASGASGPRPTLNGPISTGWMSRGRRPGWRDWRRRSLREPQEDSDHAEVESVSEPLDSLSGPISHGWKPHSKNPFLERLVRRPGSKSWWRRSAPEDQKGSNHDEVESVSKPLDTRDGPISHEVKTHSGNPYAHHLVRRSLPEPQGSNHVEIETISAPLDAAKYDDIVSEEIAPARNRHLKVAKRPQNEKRTMPGSVTHSPLQAPAPTEPAEVVTVPQPTSVLVPTPVSAPASTFVTATSVPAPLSTAGALVNGTQPVGNITWSASPLKRRSGYYSHSPSRSGPGQLSYPAAPYYPQSPARQGYYPQPQQGAPKYSSYPALPYAAPQPQQPQQPQAQLPQAQLPQAQQAAPFPQPQQVQAKPPPAAPKPKPTQQPKPAAPQAPPQAVPQATAPKAPAGGAPQKPDGNFEDFVLIMPKDQSKGAPYMIPAHEYNPAAQPSPANQERDHGNGEPTGQQGPSIPQTPTYPALELEPALQGEQTQQGPGSRPPPIEEVCPCQENEGECPCREEPQEDGCPCVEEFGYCPCKEGESEKESCPREETTEGECPCEDEPAEKDDSVEVSDLSGSSEEPSEDRPKEQSPQKPAKDHVEIGGPVYWDSLGPICPEGEDCDEDDHRESEKPDVTYEEPEEYNSPDKPRPEHCDSLGCYESSEEAQDDEEIEDDYVSAQEVQEDDRLEFPEEGYRDSLSPSQNSEKDQDNKEEIEDDYVSVEDVEEHDRPEFPEEGYRDSLSPFEDYKNKKYLKDEDFEDFKDEEFGNEDYESEDEYEGEDYENEDYEENRPGKHDGHQDGKSHVSTEDLGGSRLPEHFNKDFKDSLSPYDIWRKSPAHDRQSASQFREGKGPHDNVQHFEEGYPVENARLLSGTVYKYGHGHQAQGCQAQGRQTGDRQTQRHSKQG